MPYVLRGAMKYKESVEGETEKFNTAQWKLFNGVGRSGGWLQF